VLGRIRTFGALLAAAAMVAALGTACANGEPGVPASTGSRPPTGSPSPTVTQLKIAFVEDLSSKRAHRRVAPAFRGAKLALKDAVMAGELAVPVQLVGLDTEGNALAAAAVAREVAADPSYVAVIGAPFLTGQVTIGRILDRAGVPMITLSTLGPDLSKKGWRTWRRAVANQTEQGAALAGYVDGLPDSGRGVCLLRDGTEDSSGLLRAVAGSLRAAVVLRARAVPSATDPSRAVGAVARARCRVVVWGGFSEAGALMRRQLVEAGLGKVGFVGGDGLKDQGFLSVTGGAGVGTAVVCSCADLTAATDLPAQRFIQDFQFEFGRPPGAYAAEAFDVARMVLRAISSGAATRAGVLSKLRDMRQFHGLANVYRFRPDGELAPGSARVRLYRDEGGRWVGL
jgi:ABC-type branched-subunit amino acid transport system substrate-binding protein